MAYTYPELVSDVLLAMEDTIDSEELEIALPRAINRAQQYVARRVDSFGLAAYVTVQTVGGQSIYTTPSDVVIVRSVRYVQEDNGDAVVLQLRPNDFVRAYWPDASETALLPKYYCQLNAFAFELAPTPTSAGTVVLEYVQKVPDLSPANPTNWISQNADGALFAATMAEVNRWAKQWSAAGSWKSQADDELVALVNEARRTRRDDVSQDTTVSDENNLQKGSA